MREFLFRGKRKNGCGWAYGCLISAGEYCCILESEENVHPYDYPYLNGDIGTIDSTLTPVIPETIGLFTGLLDAIGEKIFEGDVCEESFLYHRDKHEIVYIGSSFGTRNITKQEKCMTPFDDTEFGICPEIINVIGNIHDNPELLEVSDA